MTGQAKPGAIPSDPQRLRQHLRQQPEDGAAWLQLAQVLAREPPGPELHHAVEQAIRSLPEDEAPWRLAATLHQRRGGARAAHDWLAGTAARNPQLTAPRVVLARLRADEHFREGRWAPALDEYRVAAGLRPGDPAIENAVGTCLASLERYAEALEHFERALKRQPGLLQARLNIAFVRACQGDEDGALALLDALLGERGLDPTARSAAASLQANLLERRRLQPAIDQALRTGEIDGLRAALAKTPGSLRVPHEPTLRRLRTLASRLGPGVVGTPPGGNDPGARARLEVAALCNDEGSAEDLAAGCRPSAPLTPSARRVLGLIDERATTPSSSLAGPDGEAWIRYWHARLLSGEPDKGPGQYKLAANAIKDLPLTPPENVSGTYRSLLADVLPGTPPGLPRGVLLYIAANMVHGFGDGNGRLARFLLAWECETAGLPPWLVLPGSRARTAAALDRAWLEGDPRTLVEALAAAQAEAERVLALAAELAS